MKNGKDKKSNLGSIPLLFYIAVVSLCLVVPGVLTLFERNTSGSSYHLPSFITVTESEKSLNLDFSSEFDDFFSENFGLREELVNTRAKLMCLLFRNYTGDKVVVGNDGWMYFTETTDDYTGESAMNDRGIFRMAHTIELMDEYLSQYGIKMVFFSAPNKNSIYPEYMPREYLRSQSKSNLDRLSEKMAGCKSYLNVKESLLEYKEQCSTDIYHKSDSHWNSYGAMKAYELIEANLNSRIANFDFCSFDIPENADTYAWAGDLSAMIFPTDPPNDIQYDLHIPQIYTSERPITDMMSVEIQTTCSGKYYSALCYRDSFFNVLIDPVADSFCRTRFTRALPYDLSAAVDGKYNVVIIELVERNLDQLLNKAPVATAPIREAPAKSGCLKDIEQLCELEDDTDEITINGALGEWCTLNDEDRVFIELRGEKGSVYFEAYPILDGDPDADNGFSATINKHSLPDDTYSAFIHVGNSSETVCAKLIAGVEDNEQKEQ